MRSILSGHYILFGCTDEGRNLNVGNSFPNVGSVIAVSDFLNVDTRLECNQPKTARPDIQAVYEEIQRDRAKISDHQNDLPDDFPANSDLFKFLGLMTSPETDQLSL